MGASKREYEKLYQNDGTFKPSGYSKLLDCPLCGYTPSKYEIRIKQKRGIFPYKWWYRCRCGLTTPQFLSVKLLLDYWNTRAN